MIFAIALFAQQLQTADLDAAWQSPLLKGCSYSVYVAKLDGSPVYDHDSNRRLMPASNEKLFTTAFALNDLGTSYHPVTLFWKLSDRIVVDTTGDPTMSYADLAKAKDALHATGKDPVYVHEPYRVGYVPQWEVGDLPYYYAAPITGFTVDKGAFDLWADSSHAYLKYPIYGVKIERAKAIKRHVTYDPFTRTVKVSGPLPSSPAVLESLSIPEPDHAAASILGSGFYLTDKVPTTPADFELDGPDLPAIIKDCLVHSDNILAENLLLLTAIKDGDLGDDPYLTATARVKDFVTRVVGVAPDDFHPDDGCGLSRHNWVTTRAIAKLLEWESAQPTFDLWKGCLASPGNGTLKNRLHGSSFIGKTGSFDGVTALSGYVKTKDGQTLVVSTIFNNHLCPNSEIESMQDAFIGKIESATLSGTVLEGPFERESPLPKPSTRIVSLNRVPRSRYYRSSAL